MRTLRSRRSGMQKASAGKKNVSGGSYESRQQEIGGASTFRTEFVLMVSRRRLDFAALRRRI